MRLLGAVTEMRPKIPVGKIIEVPVLLRSTGLILSGNLRLVESAVEE